MAKKPVLVVMAAGMGSRYGGLKQIDPVGSQGEAILDYSLYDAHAAGFETAVIIIKEAIRQDFMDTVGKRLEKCPMQIRYAYQELTKEVPENVAVPADRVKPWGTSHAILSAAKEIDGAPFAVINSDDYYGRSAFRVIYEALSKECDESHYFMVGYELGNTVTENGSVSRGVCQTDESGYLVKVVERTRIEQHPEGIYYTEDGSIWTELAPDTPVSMNMWGLAPGFLDYLKARFPEFLEKALAENPLKGEFLLPSCVSELLEQGKISVKVLRSADKWYGITYAADKPVVVAALKALTDSGLIPDGLWQ